MKVEDMKLEDMKLDILPIRTSGTNSTPRSKEEPRSKNESCRSYKNLFPVIELVREKKGSDGKSKKVSSLRAGSNRRPSVYKTDVTTTVLRRRCVSLIAITGI